MSIVGEKKNRPEKKKKAFFQKMMTVALTVHMGFFFCVRDAKWLTEKLTRNQKKLSPGHKIA
jgi:hypothetical protein